MGPTDPAPDAHGLFGDEVCWRVTSPGSVADARGAFHLLGCPAARELEGTPHGELAERLGIPVDPASLAASEAVSTHTIAGATQRWLWRAVASDDGYLVAGRDVTEVSHLRRELARSEDIFRQMGNAIEQVFWIFDPRVRRMTYLSPAFAKIWGMKTEDVYTDIGAMWRAVATSHRDTVTRAFQDGFRGGTTIEYQIVRSDGALRWIRDSVIRSVDPASGECTRVSGASEDVTPQKRAEEQLRQSEERLKFALESTEEGLFDWDLDSGRLFVSNRWLEMLGLTRADFSPTIDWWYSRVHPEDVPRAQEQIRQHMENRTLLFKLEHRFRNKAGEWQWILGRGKVVARDPGGKPLRMVGTNLDITDRIRAQEALRLSEERFQLALDATEDALWDWNLGTDEFYFSPRFSRMLESAADPPRTFEEWKLLVHPEDMDEMLSDLDEHLSGRKPFFEKQSRMMTGAGDWKWILTRGRVVESKVDSSPVRVVGTCKDITDSRQAEENLRVAKDAAEKAARAKSEFLAMMSHEIRTPLNGIIGMIGILEGTELTPEQREYAGIVHRSGDALISIVNDILDFSKIEADRMELESIGTSIRLLLDQIGEILSPRAAEKNLELVTVLHPEVPGRIRADPGRLRQVLLNLVSNAIKFTDHGEVVVDVRMCGTLHDQARVRFSVTDTGIGIPADRRVRLFLPFSQVDASTTRRFGGTGLGLAICKRLIEMMGGSIEVESEEGVGSTFWFELPVLVMPDPNESDTAHRRLSLRARRVLVADPSRSAVGAAAINLRMWGCRFDSATTEEEVSRRLGLDATPGVPTPYHVLLLDDRIGSEELLRQIRARRDCDALSVGVMMRAGRPKESNLLDDGIIQAILPKPLKTDALYEFLSRPAQQSRSRLRSRSPGDLGGTTPVPLRPIHILVVEDNAVNQKVARLLLEGAGHSVSGAENGVEALNALRSDRYDMILMDCMMPEMDGYEATRRIRRGDTPDPEIPIIAMTASAMEGDRERCMAAGMNDYIAKPIDSRSLLALVDRYRPEPHQHPVTPTPNRPAIDLTVMRRTSGEDEAFLTQLLATIAEDLLPRLISLKSAIAARELHRVGRQAHTLKGHVLYLGAQAVANRLRQMQANAEEGSLSACAAAMPLIEADVRDLAGELDRLLAARR